MQAATKLGHGTIRTLLCICIGRAAIESRLAKVDAPNVAPLNDWVRSIAARGILPPASAETVPWFDPHSGGIEARVLLLLQDPSGTASATRFISPGNNDPTARCTTEACNEAGLDRGARLHWNVYPWWVNVPGGSKKKGRALPDPTRPPESWLAARTTAAKLTGELFQLLPSLRVIVVLGKETQAGFRAVMGAANPPPLHIRVLDGPSLSPPGYYSHRGEAIDVLRRASQLASG